MNSVNYFEVYEKNTDIPYLATLSEKAAHEWKSLANDGGCRGLLWPRGQYEVRTKVRENKDRMNVWEF